ncbi:MAG: hypothetical protein RBR35_09880 [Salinivirgaceae bacterium]|nr:hypothetical protein [Salinivirgaceae bacterium]
MEIVLYTLFWSIVLFLIPLIYIEVEQYRALISSYLRMLSEDHTMSYGLSVIGWLHSWFGLTINKIYVLIVGVVLFLIPLARIQLYKELAFRYAILVSTLIWVVIFNHKAESPTFIIAMAGVGLWYFINVNDSKWNIALLILAIIFTSLSPSDLFPSFIRDNVFVPYVVKVVPCIIVWFYLSYTLMFANQKAFINRSFDLIKKNDH